MNLSSPVDTLRSMINEGIAVDTYLARQSHALLMTIGHNGPHHENRIYTRFFLNLQGILSDHFIVHATKLYENPSRHHANISIPVALNLLEQQRDSFKPVQQGFVAKNLSRLGFPHNPEDLSGGEFIEHLVSFFRSKIPHLDDSPALRGLKTLRDKRIVHRDAEVISEVPQATLGELIAFVTFAEDFMCVVGPAFLGMAHGTAGEYHFLGDDARRSARSLESLFGILNKENHKSGA